METCSAPWWTALHEPHLGNFLSGMETCPLALASFMNTILGNFLSGMETLLQRGELVVGEV